MIKQVNPLTLEISEYDRPLLISQFLEFTRTKAEELHATPEAVEKAILMTRYFRE